MKRRILIITKAPEFDDRGEVVLGQCEPFTSGWRLVLVPDKDSSEVLLSGAYSDLQRVMDACATIDDPEEVKRRAEELWSLQNSSVTETVAMEYGAGGIAERKILEPTKTGEMPVVVKAQLEGDGLFEIRIEGEVLVAIVADPDRASDIQEFRKQLLILLDHKPQGLILDMSRIQNLVSRAATELVVFRDQCVKSNVKFGLCNLRQNVQRLFTALDQDHPPKIYANIEAACSDVLQ